MQLVNGSNSGGVIVTVKDLMKRLGNKDWKPEPSLAAVAHRGVSLGDDSEDRAGRQQRQSKSATRARWSTPSEVVLVTQHDI